MWIEEAALPFVFVNFSAGFPNPPIHIVAQSGGYPFRWDWSFCWHTVPFCILPRALPEFHPVGNILAYLGKHPLLGKDVFIAETARVVGDVQIGEYSSIWFGTVVRGDIQRVAIGHHTNIQDNSVCHVADDWPCIVGNYVTAGHRTILHGCTIGDEVLIGMGAVLMNGVTVGEQSIIGAAALLTEGFVVPAGSLVYGSPAKIVSSLGTVERGQIKKWAEKYGRVAANYVRGAA